MWNVTFDEYPNMKDETILESMLGSSGSDTDSTNPPPPPTPAPTPVTAVPESQAKRLTPGQAQTAAATAARKKNRKGGTYVHKEKDIGCCCFFSVFILFGLNSIQYLSTCDSILHHLSYLHPQLP